MASHGMMKELGALMEKHKDKKASPMEKASGLSALLNLKNEMGGMQKDSLVDGLKEGHIKKVMVAASDKKGLAKGLDTAKDAIEGMGDSEDESDASEASESELEEETEDAEMTSDEIDEMMKILEEKKRKLSE